MKTLLIFLLCFLSATLVMAQINRSSLNRLFEQLKQDNKHDSSRLPILIKVAGLYADSALDFNKDSVNIYLNQAARLNAKIRNQNYQNRIDIIRAWAMYQSNPKTNAKELFLHLISICKRTKDYGNEAVAWGYLGDSQEAAPKNDQIKLNYYQNALNLWKRVSDPEKECELLRELADIHIRQRNFVAAEKELLQAINLHHSVSRRSTLFSYDLTAWLYISKGEYNKALFYALKTIRTMHPAADTLWAVTFYTRLRTIYRDLGNEPASLEWAIKTHEAVLKIKSYRSYVVSSGTAVIHSLIKLGRPKEALNFITDEKKKYGPFSLHDQIILNLNMGDCYYGLKKFDLAEKNYVQMIRMIDKADPSFPPRDIAIAYQSIGEFYLLTNKYRLAKPYLLKSLDGFVESGVVKDMQRLNMLLFQADSATGNFKSAIGYLQKSYRLKDSIFNANKNKQIEELQIAYNIEQKDKNINSLKNSAKLQTLNLAHAKSTRNWTIIGSTLLVLIAILLYRQAKTTRKTNKEITRKNRLLEQLVVEKEWLLKEVHHRVKNNLHTVICLLESQAKYLEDDALKAVESSQHRIFAMSLIHQKLYRTDNIKSIDMTEYIPELVNNLKASFAISDLVDVTFNVEKITLNISYAIPIGLIINEAVTNAIKHAFPGNAVGKICIGLIDDDNEITLSVFDNGIGFHGDPYCTQFQSMGIELMKGLTAEIDGHIKFEIAGGTRITVSFSPALPM